ncbi:MAG: hypothetical protein V1809_01580 [Planctomycetota bacterium]
MVFIVACWFDLGWWGFSTAILVVFCPVLIWFSRTPPFDFRVSDGKDCYVFRDGNYAKEFAALNKVAVEEES